MDPSPGILCVCTFQNNGLQPVNKWNTNTHLKMFIHNILKGTVVGFVGKGSTSS